ncbi:MAG: hypothetical protein ACYTBP_02660 [Planctomycetota bacterium]
MTEIFCGVIIEHIAGMLWWYGNCRKGLSRKNAIPALKQQWLLEN